MAEGRCSCCRQRDPRYGPVCDACRSRLASWLRDIPDLHAELEARDDVLLGPGNGGKVSGTRTPPTPLRIDPADLTNAARMLKLTRLGYPEHITDQVGYLAVASILDGWVRDWREVLNLNEGLPPPTVPDLARWLRDRAELACDQHSAIDECMDELGKLRSTLRGQLGLIEDTELRLGVACRRCDHRGVLAKLNGSDWFECTWIDEHGYRCTELMSPTEFDDWVRLDAGYVPAEQRKGYGL